MRRVWAIAVHTLRLAVRSKLVLALLALLVAAVVLVPLHIRGDGTLKGEVQVLLTYSLGLTWVLLSMTSLWAGCAALSSEIRGRQLQVLLSMPVHRWQVWAGKWLGLMVLNAILLTAAALAVRAMLQYRLARGEWAESERHELVRDVLHAHRVLEPVPLEVLPEARARLQEELASNPSMSPAQAESRLRELARLEAARRRGASPGESVEWRFRPGSPLPAGTGLRLQYQFTSSDPGRAEVKGRWWVGTPAKPQTARTDLVETGGARRVIDLPAERLVGAEEIVVSFVNEDDRSVKVFFDPESGVRLLKPEGTFALNLGASMLVLLAHLAFLTALGVTAGALFSFPVASTVAVFALLLQQLSQFIGDVARGDRIWEPEDPDVWGTMMLAIVHGLFGLLDQLLAPLRFANPLEWLSLGHLITFQHIGSVWLAHVGGYGLVAAIVGLVLFQRREVALPE